MASAQRNLGFVVLRSARLPWAVARLLAAVVGLAVAWGGVLVALLAAKVDPASVDRLGGYRAALDWLTGLEAADITATARGVVGIVGLVVGVGALVLLARALPRPALPDRHLAVASDRGRTRVAARVIERAAERAARRDPAIAKIAASFGDGRVLLSVTLGETREPLFHLENAREQVETVFARLGLRIEGIDVELAAFESTERRVPR